MEIQLGCLRAVGALEDAMQQINDQLTELQWKFKVRIVSVEHRDMVHGTVMIVCWTEHYYKEGI